MYILPQTIVFLNMMCPDEERSNHQHKLNASFLDFAQSISVERYQWPQCPNETQQRAIEKILGKDVVRVETQINQLNV